MKKKHGKEPNHERWLLTYSDLITLLMIFFVVLYASSNIDVNKYKAIAQSFGVALGGGGKNVIDLGTSPGDSGDKGQPANVETPQPTTGETEEDKLAKIKQQLDKYMADNGLSGSVTTTINERGLVVSLNDSAFFDSGQAVIKQGYDSKIIEIAKIVNKLGNYIRVEGHTDNVPIHTSQFNSNWELSAVRAINVAQLVIAKAGISPSNISVVGYGEYRPIADNSTEAGRARNRRVDIVVLNSKFNGGEQKAVN